MEYRRDYVALSVLMATLMCDAIDDVTAHGADPPADLFERFVAWVAPLRERQ